MKRRTFLGLLGLIGCKDELENMNTAKYQWFTNSGSQSWNPLSLGSKLEFWFDNQDTNTFENLVDLGDGTYEVRTQNDKTGNYSRTANNDTTGNRPIRKPFSEMGSLNGIDFSTWGLNLNEDLSTAAKNVCELFVVTRKRYIETQSNAITLFSVYDDSSVGTINRYCLFQDGSRSSGVGTQRVVTNNGGGATNNNIKTNTYTLSDKPTILNYRVSGSAYNFKVDNTEATASIVSGSNDGDWINDLTSYNKISFGYWAQFGSIFYTDYFEYEIIYCNEILTSEERAQVIDYLNDRYDCYSDDAKNIGIIFAGQSNAVGVATDATRLQREITSSGVYSHLKVWTGTNTFSTYTSANDGGSNWGADKSLLTSLAEYYRNGQIRFLKVAENGAPIAIEAGRNDFNIANSELYPTLETRALQLQSHLDGLGINKLYLVWIQGERDAREVNGGEPDAYEDNLNDILNELEGAGLSVDVYIINKLSDIIVNSVDSPSITLENLQTVQAAQEAVVAVKDNALILDMNPFEISTSDYVHFTAVGYREIGNHLFFTIKEL